MAIITTSPARIISRSPAAGRDKRNKSQSSLQLQGAKGRDNSFHKIKTPTRRAKMVPSATPTIPMWKIKIARLEKMTLSRLLKKLIYIGIRGLLVARIKEPSVVISPKRRIVPPIKAR